MHSSFIRRYHSNSFTSGSFIRRYHSNSFTSGSFIPFSILILLILIFVLIAIYVSGSSDAEPIVATTPNWFTERDALPESVIPEDQWYSRNWNAGWGPKASTYPIAVRGSSIVEVARHYLGLPYQHHHIPAWDPSSTLTGKPNESPGLDCSNYTSWVYNYGKGRKFTSNVHKQAEMYRTETGMTKFTSLVGMRPGDLLFYWRNVNAVREISHVALFTEYKNGMIMVIDSHNSFGGVTEHPMSGIKYSWYENHFSHGIRIVV